MTDVPVVLTTGQMLELTNIFKQAHLENKQQTQLTQAAAAIDRADGNVPAFTRTWIRALDGWSTEAVDDAFLIQLAKQTATGDLLEEVRRWTSAGPDGVKTWKDLRQRVLEHFLSACETLKLQAQLENTVQKEGETISAYIRRYRAEATRAYPEERPATEENRVVGSFLRGFADRTFAERLFRTGRVSTLAEAINTALDKEAEREKLEQVLQSRGHESMEVDAIDRPTASAGNKMSSMMETMQRRLEQLNTRIAKMEATKSKLPSSKATGATADSRVNKPRNREPANFDKRRPASIDRRHQWTQDGKPICGFCHQPGHLYRECQRRLVRGAANSAPSGGQK